jgi:hypothetical protein
MPWIKGQSGNPGGRPKEEHDIRKLARSRGKEAVDTLYEIMTDEKAPPSARIAASVALLDRGYGRPEQRFEGALNVKYEISDKPLTAEQWEKAYAAPLTQ